MKESKASISERERGGVALLLSSDPGLTLKEIAVLTGNDRHKIQKAIREQYGCGFRSLKKAIRLRSACAFLKGDRSQYCVKEIAAELGVTPNYLSRLVKSMTGSCPTDLRRLKG